MLFGKYLEEEIEIIYISSRGLFSFYKRQRKVQFCIQRSWNRKSKYLQKTWEGKEISDVTINCKAFFTYAEENNLVKKTNIYSVEVLKLNKTLKEQVNK